MMMMIIIIIIIIIMRPIWCYTDREIETMLIIDIRNIWRCVTYVVDSESLNKTRNLYSKQLCLTVTCFILLMDVLCLL
jgi:hypothetical protein